MHTFFVKNKASSGLLEVFYWEARVRIYMTSLLPGQHRRTDLKNEWQQQWCRTPNVCHFGCSQLQRIGLGGHVRSTGRLEKMDSSDVHKI